MMNVCAFCGPTENRLTKEHVWPRWVSKALAGVVPGDTVYHQRFEGDDVTTEWEAGEINLQVKDVCLGCNREWLGAFEAGVIMPLLGGAIAAGSPVSLTYIEQASVAAWVCKMAMVYEFANPGKPRFFTATDRLTFREGTKAPTQVEVRLARYALSGPRAGHAYSASHELTEAFGERRTLQLFLTTLVAGHLAAQLVAVRDKTTGTLLPASTVEVRYSAAAAASLVQVWYPQGRRAEWPPARALDDDGIASLSKMWSSPTQGGGP